MSMSLRLWIAFARLRLALLHLKQNGCECPNCRLRIIECRCGGGE